jgi:hypothetical protein
MRRYVELMKDHPNLRMGEIGKIVSTEWNSMSEEEKKPYQELSKIDRDRYNKEKAENILNLKNES